MGLNIMGVLGLKVWVKVMGQATVGVVDSPPGEGRRGGTFLGIEEDELLEGKTDKGRRREFADIVDALRWLTSVAACVWGENGSLEEPLSLS